MDAAYNYSGQTLQYFKKILQRNSIDDTGMDLHFYVNYGKNYLNAGWDPDTNTMVFGDGDGRNLKEFARSIDVVAHEMAHGVTQFLNNLDYKFQSGTLNEHFSDVIGSAVQQHVMGQTQRLRIGSSATRLSDLNGEAKLCVP